MKSIISLICISTSLIFDSVSAMDLEFVSDWTGKVFVLGDVLGDYGNTLNILKKADLIDESNEWKAENTLLIQLGNVIGWGADSIKLIELFQSLRDSAIHKESKVILLMGDQEYFANTDKERKALELLDLKYKLVFYGDSEEKNKSFAVKGEYYGYITTLKMAVSVNGNFFAHSFLTNDIIQEYGYKGREILEPLSLLKKRDMGVKKLIKNNDSTLFTDEEFESCAGEDFYTATAWSIEPYMENDRGKDKKWKTSSLLCFLNLKFLGYRFTKKYYLEGNYNLPLNYNPFERINDPCLEVTKFLNLFQGKKLFVGHIDKSPLGVKALCDDKLVLTKVMSQESALKNMSHELAIVEIKIDGNYEVHTSKVGSIESE
eukprot:GHVR01147159.1.p1 GENE.GHVR01147159.1~~GHVR01147159.1.p1  ORF type:complete len:374 (-),score=58.36 GHVR01147159.1:414-1535(-)